MSSLSSHLDYLRDQSRSEREKGDYFEQLTIAFLRHEPRWADLYATVQKYCDWAEERGLERTDTGIDLVGTTHTGDVHAIQCKFYDAGHTMQSGDFGRFFTASGKKPFCHRVIVTTTDKWGVNAEDALKDQQPPVTTIRLADLEASKIDWERWQPTQEQTQFREKKKPRDDQKVAISRVLGGFKEHERGKLLMACGTGKTFTSLKIAEQQAGKGGLVLFLVPSLALLSQTITEWSQEASIPMHCYAVCSDSDVGKKRRKKADDDDAVLTTLHELSYPATTDGKKLAEQVHKRHDAEHMSVVFATYHSIEAINKAQQQNGLPDFALIVCDEAHRTTGAIFAKDDGSKLESHFTRVHDPVFIKGAKRLYMTATPRIYGDKIKEKADKGEFELCSMDDEKLYGPVLHSINFSQAVSLGLLCDYKVIVLAVGEDHIARALQKELSDASGLRVDDAAKIVGCWKALAKQGMRGGRLADDEGVISAVEDSDPMRRAVAFCQVIGTDGSEELFPAPVPKEKPKESKTKQVHKVSSKRISSLFERVVAAYQQSEIAAGNLEPAATLRCQAQHVDGSMNAGAKESKLAWLRDEPAEGECRILSNVRCLSEGVDVPALDAVLFLTPRNSQVDVVQSVGRVMRRAPGKKYGYVVLPVVIPSGAEIKESLDKSENWKVVWQVLQALRSHDDRFDAFINRIEFDGIDPARMEVIAVTGAVTRPKQKPGGGEILGDPGPLGGGQHTIGEGGEKPRGTQTELPFTYEVSDIERAIYAKLVSKVGRRTYWEHWARDIEQIVRTHIARITAILGDKANVEEKAAFDKLAAEMRADLNNSITDEEVIEMLAQHLITQPIFDALFTGYAFTKENPISIALQEVIDTLQRHHIDTEAETLTGFYESITRRIADTNTDAGKQEIIRKLYDQFFGKAFPKMAERLGIVYTPVEVVDFILHSVNVLLQREFGKTLGSPDVRVLDPFTGTGTFITRLLQSDLISDDELQGKYLNGLYANEIVLLAYYIAAINIESAYHTRKGGRYIPFEGISLADTFLMHQQCRQRDLEGFTMDNTLRQKRQDRLDIRVIVGNPPYSVGQKSEDDNNKNLEYPALDARISETYAQRSTAMLSKGLYDSYVRAIRWASDRLGKDADEPDKRRGIIGFVTNAGWLDSNSADGLRKCLAEEFSSIYVFHLRGNQRTSGETSRKEGGKIFGSGSRAPIAISFLVKNPDAAEHGKICFYDIGDYLSRDDKLKKIKTLGSIAGIDALPADESWQAITPDAHGDWLRQRDESFSTFIPLGDKKSDNLCLFDNFSLGIVTNRDAWAINSSRAKMERNMRGMIDFYNREVQRFDAAHRGMDAKARKPLVDDFIKANPTTISWTHNIKHELAQGRTFEFEAAGITPSLYRPFSKQWLYFNRRFNERVYQMPHIFPCADAENFVIQISGVGARSFSLLIASSLPCLDTVEKGQCFPLYLYDSPSVAGKESRSLLDTQDGDEKRPSASYTRRDAITNEGLAHFQEAYPGETITKEDIFYYIYGLLHSPDYRERYADNLSKELPRIPRVLKAADFWAFSKAGRELAHWHLNYETVEPWPVKIDITAGDITDSTYRVEKMKHPAKGKVKDKTTVIYNHCITIRNIPEKAWGYVVNGKSALDWVMERQCYKTDKASGITNDANDWARETMHDPRYPLDLFCRVIRVSMETLRIVDGLPKLDI
ncbi:MAG: DEAD/DEAH box helicase [Actinomycetaceae bacterium]|nr:DEAD/DEAH box helicase [Actinomycetaceae bacterium]